MSLNILHMSPLSHVTWRTIELLEGVKYLLDVDNNLIAENISLHDLQ